MNILVGCDPEVFVKKDGLFHSAFGLIKGDKKNPQPVKRGAVQVDGMALEFNIDPASNSDEFILNVEEVYATLRAMVPEYEVVATPVAHFTPEYMKAQPAAALELGCDPDFNGWTYQANPRPQGDRPFRTAAGHVHIGWTEGENVQDFEHFQKCCHVAKQMDFFLGLPSLFYDHDKQRRELYGRAGACRVKSYGAEYRTLSNEWLNSRERMKWVFDAVQIGMERLIEGDCLYEKYGDIQNIINSSDWSAAEAILHKENIEIPHV